MTFELKMQQNLLAAGAPLWMSYSAPSGLHPMVGFRKGNEGRIGKGGKRRGRKERRKGGEYRGRGRKVEIGNEMKGKSRDGIPQFLFNSLTNDDS